MDAESPPPNIQITPTYQQSDQLDDKAQKAHKLAKASKIIGIISLIIFPISMTLAIIGLILGIVGKVRGAQKVSGIVMNSIAIGLSIVSLVIGVFLIICMSFGAISNTVLGGEYMECSTSYGDTIAISYNETSVTGYIASGNIDFDLDYEQDIASSLGVENYLNYYAENFENNHYGGVCTRELRKEL